MEPTKEELTNRLVAAIQDLPKDDLLTVLHFVGYLQSISDQLPRSPERGSPEAISKALDRPGLLRFDSGELAALPADIEYMREADIEEHD